MNRRSAITAIASYLPQEKISSQQIEERINRSGTLLPHRLIESKFGVKERRFAATEEQASDLAAKAARKILDTIEPSTIDCLIFASGSSDMIEPATANMVQSKLRLFCPVFDIKNACSSFVSGLEVANSLVVSGTYKKVLVTTGEKLSTIIKFDVENKEDLVKRLASLSMGDAGAAVLVEPATDERGIYGQCFETHGAYWHLCTVPGGGSVFPHEPGKVYFEGKTKELRDIFMEKKNRIAERCLAKTGWKLGDIDHFFMHHVSLNTFELVADSLGVDVGRFYNVVEDHGNMAAASIPVAMTKAIAENKLKKGDKIMLIGLASGISISIQLMIW